jgi:hypothetical protein
MTETATPRLTGWYLHLLRQFHAELRPATYLEVGVHTGQSLTLLEPETLAIGIDPVPSLRLPVNTTAKLFFETSDEFFAKHDVRAELGGRTLDLAFIDGMHLFEYALRDFRNIERYCGPNSVVLVHDCYPEAPEHATRHRNTREWTGDTWKIVLSLKEFRPDLDVNVIRVGCSGLGIIRGMSGNGGPTALDDRYDEILERYTNLEFTEIDARKDEALGAVPNDWDTIRAMLPQVPVGAAAAAAPARKKLRITAPIVRHQAVRSVKIVGSRAKRAVLRRPASA